MLLDRLEDRDRRLGPAPERLSSSGESLGGTEPAPERPSSFGQLGLTPELLRAVAAQGYTQPTPVQAQAIPIVLAGRDLLASAQTGTGKTAAFVLPILQLLNASRPAVRYLPAGKGRRGATGLPIRCLVLTPTRELALQVEESVRTYGAERPVRSTIVYGGVGFDPQVRALRGGPEIVVATPGRLLDHAGQGTIDLGSVEILVLDEADRMLDMGFIRDIRRILALLPARRQNLLFSATFSDEIRGLADGLLHLPASVQIARRNSAIELVRQVVYPVDRERKRELLSYLIRSGRIDRALVFTRTKHGANRLAEQLGQDGISAAAIHGNKSQGQRVRALGSRSWWPPRSPPEASTSRACPTSSTSSCRRWPRTTSTGSVEPVARVWKATPCRLFVSTRTRFSSTSRLCSAREFGARWCQASRSIDLSAESRSGCAASAPTDRTRVIAHRRASRGGFGSGRRRSGSARCLPASVRPVGRTFTATPRSGSSMRRHVARRPGGRRTPATLVR